MRCTHAQSFLPPIWGAPGLQPPRTGLRSWGGDLVFETWDSTDAHTFAFLCLNSSYPEPRTVCPFKAPDDVRRHDADEAAGRDRRFARWQVAGLLRHDGEPDREYQNSGALAAGDRRPLRRNSAPFKLAVGQPGDSDPQFAPDGKQIFFISSRDGAPQIWLADFDSATGATSHLRKLTNLDLGIDNAKWSPDGRSIVFTASVYPDCPAIAPNDNGAGAECNYDRAARPADSKVKAQISPTSSIATGTTTPATSAGISFSSRSRAAKFVISIPATRMMCPVFARRLRLRLRHLARWQRAGVHRKGRA